MQDRVQFPSPMCALPLKELVRKSNSTDILLYVPYVKGLHATTVIALLISVKACATFEHSILLNTVLEKLPEDTLC